MILLVRKRGGVGYREGNVFLDKEGLTDEVEERTSRQEGVGWMESMVQICINVTPLRGQRVE